MIPEPEKHESPPGQPPDPTKKKEREAGWIDSFAQRSTGLPGSGHPQPPPSDERSPWSYAGLGFQFAATTAVFALMGVYLDHRFGWSPWGTVSLSILGVTGGLYLLIKDALKRNRDEDRKP
jgi:ATP synthase protein I